MALYPDQLVRPAQINSVEAAAPVREAAAHGNVEMIELLMTHGGAARARVGAFGAMDARYHERVRLWLFARCAQEDLWDTSMREPARILASTLP